MTGFPFGLLAIALSGVLAIMVVALFQYDWEDDPDDPPEELSRRVSALETAVYPDAPERDRLVMFVERADRGEYGDDPSVDTAARFVRDMLEIQDGELADMEEDTADGDDGGEDA
jgi:hypothetical protein